MYKLVTKMAPASAPVFDTLVLPFELRQRGRFRCESRHGHEIGIFLPRGDVLRDGDLLRSECGVCFAIEAQKEAVVVARSSDWLTFARACYHLGNRHVPLQIGAQWLRFQPDHVLEDLVCQLGLSLDHDLAPFDPETGAYAHGHAHSGVTPAAPAASSPAPHLLFTPKHH